MGSVGRTSNRSNSNLHVFPENHRSTHTYEDDNGNTAKWMRDHTNSDEIITSIVNNGKEDYFFDWGSGYFMDGQQYKGFSNMSNWEQEATRVYDTFLDKSIAKEGFRVTRLTDFKIINNGKDLDVTKFNSPQEVVDYLNKQYGQSHIFKGNMSFGAANEGLTIGHSVSYSNAMGGSTYRGMPKALEVRYEVPKGSKGAGTWIGDRRINHWGSDQREFMSNRDTIVKQGRVTYDKKRDIFVVTLTYQGRTAHDYS